MVMTLEEKINADIKSAMLAKEASKLEALRAIKSAILLMKTSGADTNADAEIKALQKMVKQRKETAELYTQQGRQDLADVELSQASIIEYYLPQQMGVEEVDAVIKDIIKEMGVTNPSDMGKVIGAANKKLAGMAEGKVIADSVKKILSNL
jgi:uncharacterized protein YqeY